MLEGRAVSAGLIQRRVLQNAVACTAAGPGRADTWERSHLHNAERVYSCQKVSMYIVLSSVLVSTLDLATSQLSANIFISFRNRINPEDIEL